MDWRRWLETHSPALVLFARNWAASHAEAEDLVQEAFVRFWPKRTRVDDPRAYLYQCIRSAAIDAARSSQQRRQRETTQATQTTDETRFETSLETRELTDSLEQALAALPAEQAEVVTLKIWSELTFEQIAKITDIPPATAASRYRYAIQRLRILLGESQVP